MIKTRLIKMLSHARKYIVYQVLWQWVTLVAQIVLMYAAVHLLWNAYEEMTQGVAFEGGKYLIMVAIAGAVRFVANRRAAKASFEASVDVKRILRDKIYEKLLRLGASYREQVPTSEIVQLAGEGVEQLETYFGKFLSQFFYSLIAPLTLFIVLFHVSWKASLVLLVCVPLIPGVIMMVQKIAKRLLSKYWDIYAGLGDSFLENLQGMTTLKIYRADAKKAEQMDYESERFRIITMKVLQMQLNSIIIMDAIAYGGAALGMIITIGGYLNGEIDFPGALWIILLAVEFFLPMRRLGSFFHVAMNGMAASDKIFRLLDLPEPEEKSGMIADGALDIEIRGLCFSYGKGDNDAAGAQIDEPEAGFAGAQEGVSDDSASGVREAEEEKGAVDGARDVLTDVAMDFPAGSFTSLVGASGCGKSTIAGILMGRNRGYRGSVKVGGLELSEINEQSLMEHITLVSNNSHLFKGTVGENLAMGNPGADEDRLLEVLGMVNLDGFISAQRGLDTEIAENGSNLSGGQRQRLALARALLHDTPVYIFDEATSNIDSESEEMIMSVIHRLAETRTVILISHRLANVVSSDRIYMLEGGRVCQSGTHEGLMAAGGAYRELYERQRELEAYGRGQTPADLGTDLGGFGDRPRAIRGQTPGDSGTDLGQKGVRPRAKKGPTSGDSGSDPGKRRPGPVIMGRLIGLVKPLLPVMLVSVTLGVAGFLCAISLTILAAGKLLEGIGKPGSLTPGLATGTFFAVLFIAAVLRGVLHYGEQYCNHFIAFKLLAIIRHKVFANLRRLCPAKLEGKDRGNLISIITSDIELLEVFYAHTISPIAIATIVSVIMTLFIGRQDPWAGLLALCAYVTVGAVIPLAVGKAGGDRGLAFRNKFGELNSFVLDSIRGIDETIQYADGGQRRKEIGQRSVRLSQLQRQLANLEAAQTSVTYIATLLFSFGMLFLMLYEYREGNVTYANALTATVSMMGSFGPVMALSNLANSLNQTLASGERVLSLLEEEPQVAEVTNGKDVEEFTGAGAHGVTFAYGNRAGNANANSGLSQEYILSDYSLEIPRGKVVGIYGASGSGKSTLLRLLMRFWDVTDGRIELSGTDVREINTASLRNMESYVEQETHLFHDSIANNIAVGKLDATREEIMEAAKKASIHDFIMTLPNGYDTEVGELGDTLSGGERQRIGIARAFLHDAPLLLLDEPTSNLDSLNEGIILKSLAETMASEDRTVVLVSHRKSTLSMADVAYRMESGRLS